VHSCGKTVGFTDRLSLSFVYFIIQPAGKPGERCRSLVNCSAANLAAVRPMEPPPPPRPEAPDFVSAAAGRGPTGCINGSIGEILVSVASVEDSCPLSHTDCLQECGSDGIKKSAKALRERAQQGVCVCVIGSARIPHAGFAAIAERGIKDQPHVTESSIANKSGDLLVPGRRQRMNGEGAAATTFKVRPTFLFGLACVRVLSSDSTAARDCWCCT
jgi:hypothetical protein